MKAVAREETPNLSSHCVGWDLSARQSEFLASSIARPPTPYHPAPGPYHPTPTRYPGLWRSADPCLAPPKHALTFVLFRRWRGITGGMSVKAGRGDGRAINHGCHKSALKQARVCGNSTGCGGGGGGGGRLACWCM